MSEDTKLDDLLDLQRKYLQAIKEKEEELQVCNSAFDEFKTLVKQTKELFQAKEAEINNLKLNNVALVNQLDRAEERLAYASKTKAACDKLTLELNATQRDIFGLRQKIAKLAKTFQRLRL